MKKKISLKEVTVKSFVTQLDQNQKQTVQGGAATQLCDLEPTNQSCYHYMSCNAWECVATRYGNGEQVINCNEL